MDLNPIPDLSFLEPYNALIKIDVFIYTDQHGTSAPREIIAPLQTNLNSTINIYLGNIWDNMGIQSLLHYMFSTVSFCVSISIMIILCPILHCPK